MVGARVKGSSTETKLRNDGTAFDRGGGGGAGAAEVDAGGFIRQRRVCVCVCVCLLYDPYFTSTTTKWTTLL